MTPVDQFKKAEDVADANGKGLFVDLKHGRLITIAERFPKIDPRPYWIRYWLQIKVPHTLAHDADRKEGECTCLHWLGKLPWFYLF